VYRIHETLAAIAAGLTLILSWSSATSRARAEDTPNYQVRPDVVYGHKDGMALTFDVFEPTEGAKGIGLLLMVSGGWVSPYMPPPQTVKFFQPLLNHGYTVLAVRHGSSPRYVIPEIAQDVNRALEFIHAHAQELKVDPRRLGVFGFSAGGHLSLLLGTKTNGAPGTETSGPRVAAVAAVYPPTDLGPYVDLNSPMRERFPALKFDVDKAPEFSPLMHVTRKNWCRSGTARRSSKPWTKPTSRTDWS
jgi:acetyl esterase/lipase